MKTQARRYAQNDRNSDLRAAKRWRGQQRATYPWTYTRSGQLPGAAAVRAIERDGATLTQSRISFIAAFPTGQPQHPRHMRLRKLLVTAGRKRRYVALGAA